MHPVPNQLTPPLWPSVCPFDWCGQSWLQPTFKPPRSDGAGRPTLEMNTFKNNRIEPEQAYRYNNREFMDDFDRFKLAMSQIVGKVLAVIRKRRFSNVGRCPFPRVGRLSGQLGGAP